MTKLNGIDRINTAVFISGTGSKLKKLIKFSQKKNSKFKISLIISNNYRAKGLKYSNIFKIKKKIYKFDSSKNEEKLLIKELKKNKIKIICLAGFMRILPKSFIKSFKGIILNIHPSLLPKFKGLNTHVRAIKNKEMAPKPAA